MRANYFKLGVFVIGAVISMVAILLIVGSGRWFTPKLTVETYFNESVQGLDIGSKLKYRGVEIGSVTRITFTYTRYQLDRPISQRARYVLVESEIRPRLLGGRAAAGDLTEPTNAALEVDRGLRVKLTPQGITGTNYLEIDYVEPTNNPVLAIDWAPQHIYIPSARSTLTGFVDAASEIVDRLRNLDVESTLASLNKLLGTTNERIADIDTKALAKQTERTLARIETTMQGIATKDISNEAITLLKELRTTNQELKATIGDPAWRQVPKDASAAVADLRKLVTDPKLASTVTHLERTLGRLDRITGGGAGDLTSTLENLRQITDNLRQLTEDAKRYPSNLLFGQPPPPTPLERLK
ncbi:MAG TPA: MlaD family protein [Casimicrobiaceae bacterium]|nr:MlaD family protein [Casimicrobiaceae bacterium]